MKEVVELLTGSSNTFYPDGGLGKRINDSPKPFNACIKKLNRGNLKPLSSISERYELQAKDHLALEKDMIKKSNFIPLTKEQLLKRSQPTIRYKGTIDGYQLIKLKHPYKLQSEDLEEAEAVITKEQLGDGTIEQQTVTFVDNEGGAFYNAPITDNAVAMVDNTEDIALGTFLSRPTLINTTTWTTSDLPNIKTTMQPWHLFLNDTIIRRKIENYAFIRGNLHIKVVLNGTPFQYGAMRACYTPLLGFMAEKFTPHTPFIPNMIPFSQMPGFFMYPQANGGGEIVLPFLLHKNWLDMTSLSEVQNMGTLRFVIYSPLQVASSGGTTTVSLRTYAWMTDVHLMGSTTSLLLQSSDQNDDEYGNGTISAPATAIASISRHLGKVPIIGRFARATEIGASAVSSIAQLFGYTDVPNINNINAMQPMNAPMLASSHISVPLQKLTLDPKQELSIDPSAHGIGSQDELAMPYMLSKESFFALTSWATTDAVGTQIFNMRVNPYQIGVLPIYDLLTNQIGNEVNHTPLAYVGNLLNNWRGDLIVRIKVVCTKFHKGRLKISYDPRGNITTSDPPENSVYTEIVDIGENDDIEIRIPYHQDLAWLKINKDLSENWTPGNPLANRVGIDNGLLSIRVLTNLTAPTSSNINLLFFIRGAENLEYANPASVIGPTTSGIRPSLFQLQAEDKTDVISKKFTMGTPALNIPERYALNFGESVGSLRNILHRATTVDTVPLTESTTTNQYSFYAKNYKRMPYSPGYVASFPTNANRLVTVGGTYNYAFNTMHPLPYITSMFIGYRGSVNYYVTPSTDKYGFFDDLRVTRITDADQINSSTLRFISNYANVAFGSSISAQAFGLNMRQYTRDGLGGMAIDSNRTNSSLTFNFPDYNNRNFAFADPTNYMLGSSVDGTDEQTALMQFNLKKIDAVTNAAAGSITVHSAASAGPDFTCLYFLCCPTIYYTLTFPTPA